ncbi:MAG: endonuclease NucS domain-containing protein [Candidatus Hodarchaeales archaeon]
MKEKIAVLPKSLKDLASILPNFVEKRSIFLIGKCESSFDGRIKSKQAQGERILIIKKDGSVLLHNPTGTRPVQWQKPKVGKIDFIYDQKKSALVMQSYRPKTDESFFINFFKIDLAVSANLVEDFSAFSQITGDEKDFVNQLVNQPDLIESGLSILEYEKEIPYGFIDLFAVDSKSRKTVIEVKKANATLADAHQLQRYVNYFEEINQKVRGILVASNIPERVKKYLQSNNLEGKTIPWQKIFPTLKRPTNINRSKSLDNFLGEYIE